MIVFLWDYYEETNFLLYRITEAWHFLVSYLLKRNLNIIQNFTLNTRKLLKSILKRDTQQKLKMKNNTNNAINYLPHHRMVNVNTPGKVRVVFDAEVTYNLTLLKSERA